MILLCLFCQTVKRITSHHHCCPLGICSLFTMFISSPIHDESILSWTPPFDKPFISFLIVSPLYLVLSIQVRQYLGRKSYWILICSILADPGLTTAIFTHSGSSARRSTGTFTLAQLGRVLLMVAESSCTGFPTADASENKASLP